jgi:hypothetical protein
MSREPKGRTSPQSGKAARVLRPDVPTVFVSELSDLTFDCGIVVLSFSELRVQHGHAQIVEVARLAMPSQTASEVSDRIRELAAGAHLHQQRPSSTARN